MTEAAEKIEPEADLDGLDNYFDFPKTAEEESPAPETDAGEFEEELDDTEIQPDIDEAPEGDEGDEDHDEYSFLNIEDPKKRRAIGKRLMEKAKREAAEKDEKLKEFEKRREQQESVDRISEKLGLKKTEEKESLDDKLVRLGKATNEEIDLDDFMSDTEKRAVALSLENKLHSQRAQEREIITEITSTISGFVDQQRTAGNAEMAGIVDQCYNAAIKSELVAIRSANPGLDARTAQTEAERSLVGKAYQLAAKQGKNADPAAVILQYGASILDELGVPQTQPQAPATKQAPLIDKKAREGVMERAGSPAVQVDNSGTEADRRAQKVRKEYDAVRSLYDQKG